MTRFPCLRSLFAVSASAALLLAVAAPASADRGGGGGEVDGGSVGASAEITVTGDVKGGGGGGGSVTASAPAICWWEKAEFDTSTVEAIAAIFTFVGLPFDSAAVAQIKKDIEDGKKLEWYVRKTREGATEAQIKEAGCDDWSGPYRGLLIGNTIRPFEPGNPPEPIPDPKEMADVAFKSIDLQEPTLDWNPKAKALGGGTLVNLPTWFWVTNPNEAVGNADGERTVTATAAAGDAEVRVVVTTRADKMQIASPGGAVTCSTDQARTAYSRGTAENSACTLDFQRSSAAFEAGFPVQATVAWTASWVGTGPGVPAGEQQLNGVTLSSTTDVPVRESQAVVRDVG